MSWEKVSIKDVALGIYDGPHATPPEANSGAIFLGISNFVNGQLDLTSIRYISEDDYPKWTKRVIPQENDIVFSYEATLNLYAIIPKGFRGCLGRRMALIRPDETKINHKFLYYYFYSKAWRDVISENTVLGATVDRIPLVKFPEFQIEVPPIDIQNRIATILSTYDDLIENNQKQIKLLEEAAQRLYKEWFVDLRFPGYEDVTVVDGVPEGWSTGILDDIAYESGKNEKKERRDNYNYYLPIDCLPKQSLGYTETADIGLAESSLVNFVKDDIIFGAMRPYFHKVVIARDSGLTRSTCFVLNSRQNEFWSYLAMLMFSKDTVDYATQISVGTTMPYARWKDLKQMPVIIPSKTVAEKFQSAVKPIIEKIGCLSKEIISLRQARDILLPKLMSVELDLAETKKADILQPLPKRSYDEFLSDLGMAARAKTVSEADLRAMYEAYLDDDAEDRD